MANTTNYNWETPDDTDLVKDGALAIRTLGSAVDTTVFNNAAAAIAKSIVDAKGDIIAATAADTVSRLAVGANDTVLTADSSTATGLKWAAPASGGFGNYADYTPTYSSFTLGNGTVVAKQAQSNNTVHTYGRITLGSTSSVSGAWEISLPTAVAFTSLGYQGFCSYLDASASLLYVGWMNFGIGGGAVFRPRSLTASQIYAGDIGAGTPFTWTTSDILYWNVIYAKA